jgi:hypothetical protein
VIWIVEVVLRKAPKQGTAPCEAGFETHWVIQVDGRAGLRFFHHNMPAFRGVHSKIVGLS